MDISHIGKFSEEEYNQHVLREQGHFNKNLYWDDLTEKGSEARAYLLNYFKNKKVKKHTGLTIKENILKIINSKCKSNNSVKILSLGCGPGGWELNLAKNFNVNFTMDCIDINNKLLCLGQQKAESLGFKFNFFQQDINKLKLPNEEYDVVLAHASLHHMINHEHISNEVKNSLKEDGYFIVQEPIPRNGLLMWDDTKKIANEIWSIIPSKYKYDCIDKKNKDKFLFHLPEIDQSRMGFECIRSEDLYPILKENFKIITQVFGFSFARRFVDTRFGCNYDIQDERDKTIIDLVIKLDEVYTKANNLKPESVFLIMNKD